MTQLTMAGADRSAPAAAPTAADLAARIPLPVRLPERHDGERLHHLSPSSYSLWVSCPEAWRRRYIKGEKPPPSGSMFLGSRVDDALSAYHRRILEHGDRLALDQLLDLYREQWHAELDAEREKQGIDWHEDLPEPVAFELGRQAIGLAMAELVPHLGDPVDVQRRLEFTLAPGLEWTSSATSTSRRSRYSQVAIRSRRSPTSRSRAARSARTRPTRTRRPGSTSRGAGWKAVRFSG